MLSGPRLALAAALVAVAGVAPATPAVAAACEQGGGVTVVVDFASLGSGVDTDCAAGDPGSGVDALRDSGHEPTRAAQQPGYFVCRIDGLPAEDPCQRASPEDAYWSYWHARPGGSWTYSNTGPADFDPAPGTVEGWAFGAGNPPSVAPPRERSAAAPAPSRTRAAAVPSPALVRSPSPQAAVGKATSLASPSPQPSAATAPSPTAASSPKASAAASPAPAKASPSPSVEAAASGRLDDTRSNDEQGGAGSLAGVLAALGVMLLLGSAAAYQLSRRRARDAAV